MRKALSCLAVALVFFGMYARSHGAEAQPCPRLPSQAEVDTKGSADKSWYMVTAVRQAYPGIEPLRPYNHLEEWDYSKTHKDYRACSLSAQILIYNLGVRSVLPHQQADLYNTKFDAFAMHLANDSSPIPGHIPAGSVLHAVRIDDIGSKYYYVVSVDRVPPGVGPPAATSGFYIASTFIEKIVSQPSTDHQPMVVATPRPMPQAAPATPSPAQAPQARVATVAPPPAAPSPPTPSPPPAAVVAGNDAPSGVDLPWDKDQPWMKASDPQAVKLRVLINRLRPIREKIAMTTLPEIRSKLAMLKADRPEIAPSDHDLTDAEKTLTTTTPISLEGDHVKVAAQLYGLTTAITNMESGIKDLVAGEYPDRYDRSYKTYGSDAEKSEIINIEGDYRSTFTSYDAAHRDYQSAQTELQRASNLNLPPAPIAPVQPRAGWYSVTKDWTNFFPKGFEANAPIERLPAGLVLKFVKKEDEYHDRFEIVGMVNGSKPSAVIGETGLAPRGGLATLPPETVTVFNASNPAIQPISQTAKIVPRQKEPLPPSITDVEENRPFFWDDKRNGIPASDQAAGNLATAIARLIADRRAIAILAFDDINQRIYSLQNEYPELVPTKPTSSVNRIPAFAYDKASAGLKLYELQGDKASIADLSGDLHRGEAPNQKDALFFKYARDRLRAPNLDEDERRYREAFEAYQFAWRNFRDQHPRLANETVAKLCPSREVAMNDLDDAAMFQANVKTRSESADACEKLAVDEQVSPQMFVKVNGKPFLWALIPLGAMAVILLKMFTGPPRPFAERLNVIGEVANWFTVAIQYAYAHGHNIYTFGAGLVLILAGIFWATSALFMFPMIILGTAAILLSIDSLRELLMVSFKKVSEKSPVEARRSQSKKSLPKHQTRVRRNPDGSFS